MRLLVRAGVDREVQWKDRRFLIEPPSIRDAVELMFSRPGYLLGDLGHTRVFHDALVRFMPPSLATELTRGEVDRRKVWDCLVPILTWGIPEKPKPKPKKPGSYTFEHIWHLLLGRYCATFGGEPWIIYTTTPWSFFLLMLDEARRIEGEKTFQIMEATNIANMEKKDRNKVASRVEADVLAGATPPSIDELAEIGYANLRALKMEQTMRSRGMM
jgi:hypothetical protein